MDIYRQLQQQLDTYSLGFPATESGIEISILKDLFSPSDAELFTKLTPRLETPGGLAERLGEDESSLSKQLEEMASRGLLFRQKKEGAVRYGAVPFMHGIMEFQVKNFSRDLAQKIETYLEENFYDAIAMGAEHFIHPVPARGSIPVQVNEPLSLERHVASHEDAVAILESKDLIVVTECICRKEKNMLGKGCHRPVENCFMFGSMARYYLDNNMGRQVDLEEAKTIVARSQEAGLVTQPSTSLNPSGMCNCCGDCCGVLLSLKRQDEPASLVFSNHFARVDAGSCTACENCIDYCPMEALSISDEGIAEVDLRRCIGCGVCVIQCNEDALYLQRKDESAVRVPPENEAARMMTLAKKRGIL